MADTVVGQARITWDDGPLTAAIGSLLERALAAAGRDGVDVARSLARVDTGAMRDSVVAVVDHPEPLLVTLQLRAGDGLPDVRALYNETGTSRMPAQPFIRPGGDAVVAALPHHVAALWGAVR